MQVECQVVDCSYLDWKQFELIALLELKLIPPSSLAAFSLILSFILMGSFLINMQISANLEIVVLISGIADKLRF
jgi:hypothetical protein